MKKIITVDGPAGSGKEKISKYIARKYKLYHLDSGILYRRLAYELSKKKIETDVENFISTEIEWLPLNKVSSKDENAEDIKKLLELLDDEDDVQRVYSNFGEED